MPEVIPDPLLPPFISCSHDQELKIFNNLLLIHLCVARGRFA